MLTSNQILSSKYKTRLLLASLYFLATPLHLAAEEEAEKLPKVTVTASPLEPSILEYGKPASVMNRQQIESRLKTTLGETIELEPGVRSSFFGAGSSRPVIRGFAGDRVKIMQNGLSTGDLSNISEDHLVTADPIIAQQIEILRGPETLIFGNSAIGGAVNVSDDSIAETPVGKPFHGEILGQLGNSADNEKTAAVKMKGEVDSINWYISSFSRRTSSYEIPGYAESRQLREAEAAGLKSSIFRHEHSGHNDHVHGHDYDHEDDHDMHHDDHGMHHDDHHHDDDHEVHSDNTHMRGKVPNTDTETYGGTIGVSHVWDKGFIGLSLNGLRSDYGIPGHSHNHGHEDHEDHDDHEDHHDHEDHNDNHHTKHRSMEIHSSSEGSERVMIEARQHRANIRGRINEVSDAIEAISFRLGASDYEHKEIENGEVATVLDRSTFEKRLEFIHAPLGNLSGTFGFQFFYDNFNVSGEEAYLPDSNSYLPGFFVYESLGLTDSLNFDFGGRVESVTHSPVDSSSKNFVPFSLSAGPVWNITGEGDYTLALNMAYTERAPTTSELYSEGAHIARQIYESGSTDIGKERAAGVDLKFSKNSGIFTGALTPFYQNFSNYINLAGSAEFDEGLQVFNYEETEAYFWGFEYLNTLHFDRFLELGQSRFALDLQLDYVRARDTDSNTNLPRIPPLRTITRARYGLGEDFEAMIEGVFVSKQDKTSPFELETSGYNLLNTEVSVKLPLSDSTSTRLFARGTNLTDEEARVHTSFLKDLAPQRGRSFLFGVKGVF